MLQELAGLWLPILVSAVVIFILSAVVWMVLPHHKKEWTGADNEAALLDVLRAGTKPGQYMFPFLDWGEKDPDAIARYAAGPHGNMTVWAGPPKMGRNMLCTFIFFFVVLVGVAYIAAIALEPGAEFMKVFQITGATAFLAFTMGGIPHGIWFGRSVHSLVTDFIDATVYALVAAGIFGALWPAGAVG